MYYNNFAKRQLAVSINGYSIDSVYLRISDLFSNNDTTDRQLSITSTHHFGIIAPGAGHIYLGIMRRGLVIVLVSSAITVISGYFLVHPQSESITEAPLSVDQMYQILLVVIPLRLWQSYDLRQIIKRINPDDDNNIYNFISTPNRFKCLTMIIVATYLFYLIFPVSMYFAFGDPNPFFRGKGGSRLLTINDDDTIIQQNSMLPDASFDKLKVGDIISFDRPDGVSDEIQHRIVFIKTDENGHRIVMTKGDANQGPIPGVDFPITEDKYTGKLVYVIYDPLGLYRLEDIPIYLLVTPVVASTLYYYYYHQYLSPSSQSKKKKE